MRTLILNAIFFLTFFLLMFAPALLILYPNPYTAALAWVSDKLMQGFTSAASYFAVRAAYALASRACKRLNNAPTPSQAPTATPSDLEAGTLRGDEIVLELEAATASSPTSPPLEISIIGLIFMLVPCAGLVGYQFWWLGIVSAEKPALENLSAALSYLLGGWVVVFGFWLVTVLAVWVQNRKLIATPSALVKTYFEDTLPEEEARAGANKEVVEQT
ncbi:hypothetical protein B0H16DRAFT_1578155 [Mycena metata]|uniref:Uncharacterized protein n=1 Tax=Mycena metata TaxID=1033252 RepID=A0AAD7I3G6_9AGAR|nr:hypothetical protein B0H16DRAFT_1578155 [Mycena metata]